MSDLKWSCREFEELSPALLYKILKLRTEVFVMEQEAIYQDMDDSDQTALHVTGVRDGEVVCYSRLIPPGQKYPGASIGRVVASQTVRGMGMGKVLMQVSLDYLQQHWGETDITISAQLYLEQFYTELGFITVGESYIEDSIPHIEMLRKIKK